MPPVVPWMTRTDRYILQLLDQAGIVAPPRVIQLELSERHGEDAPSRRQIARRLTNELSEHGLVDQPFADDVRGYYAITDLGEHFLHDPDAEPAEFVANMDESHTSD